MATAVIDEVYALGISTRRPTACPPDGCVVRLPREPHDNTAIGGALVQRNAPGSVRRSPGPVLGS